MSISESHTTRSAGTKAPAHAPCSNGSAGAHCISVLHVITGLDTGGAEMMLFRLLREMDRASFRPTVASFLEGGAVRPRIEDLGIPVHTIGMRQGRPSVSGTLKMARLVRQIRPDLIQGWMYHGNLAASTGVWLSGFPAPVAWNVRASLAEWESHSALTRGVIRLGARCSRQVSAIVYNSHRSAAQHESIGYSAAHRLVIPNGFDCTELKPNRSAREELRSGLGLGPAAPLIGLIARFDRAKDHPTFLQAAARMRAVDGAVHFVLAGRGVDDSNEELMRLVRELGLADRVHLLGERNDIAALNAGLDVATLSSWSEAFPNTVGEAMACGVPCVATDVGDAVGIVGDTGRIVPPRDPEALASAWQSILALDEEDRATLGVRARQRILEQFSIETVTRQYEAMYRQLLGRQGVR